MISNIVRIQLIDGQSNGFLDVKQDVAFPLNFAISDIRDVSSRTGSFSKTIVLAGTKNNNILLNNYFDVNVKAGTFNVNKTQKCAIIQNGVVIKDNFYLRLLKVVKTQNRGEEIDDLVEYEVQVRDSIGDFFKNIDNKEVSDLTGFDNFNHNYNVANVVDSFSHTWQDGYKYVLPWIGAPDPLNYDLKELLPGIYAKQIWNKIHQQAGFSYEWQSLSADTVMFDKLIIPYFGDKKKLSEEDKELNTVEAESTGVFNGQNGLLNFAGNQGAGFFTRNSWELIPTPSEIKDIQGYFDPTTGVYDNQFIITPPDSLQYEVIINYDLIMNNLESVNATLVGSQFNTLTPKLRVLDANNTEKGITNIGFTSIATGTTPQNVCVLINNGQTIRFKPASAIGSFFYFPPGETVVANGNLTTTVTCSNLNDGDLLRLGIDSSITQGAGAFWNKETTFAAANVKPKFRINSITIKIVPNSDSGLIINAPISLNQFLPTKVKQSEFLKSIYQKYNLYAEIDTQNPNKIIYTSRDEYYDSGTLKDWTQKLDKSQSQELYFVPEISSKKMILSYKDDDSDDGLNVYKGEVGETYGQVEIEFENENVRGVERKEEMFSPTLNLPTDFGAILPSLAADFKMNMRVLIDGGQYSCNTYTITQTSGNITSLNTYPYMGMLNKPFNASFSIEYAQPDYYPYNPGVLTQNNLYVNFWGRTLAQINSGKLLKAYFWLTEEDIFKLRLNDKIKINNALWYINAVVDYDANAHKPTLVELLSVEDDLKLPRFGRIIKPVPVGITPNLPVSPIKPTTPLKPIVFSVTENIKKRTAASSVFGGVVDTRMNLGVRNLISKDFVGVVVGNDKTIVDNGFYVDDTSIKNGEVIVTNQVKINNNGLTVNNLTFGPNGIEISEQYFDGGYIDEDYTVSSIASNSFNYDPDTNKSRMKLSADFINMTLPSFADDADAGANGLSTGDIYQTDGTGSLAIIGVVMIKQ